MRHTDPLACDGLPTLRMLLSVASMCGIRELLGRFADRADEAEMISLWPSSHTSATAAAVEGVPRFPSIGRIISCNSLDERRPLRLARVFPCQDRLRAFVDVEHDRRAGPLAVPTLGLGRKRIPLSIARRETVVLPNALWGKGLRRGFARSAQLRLRADRPHPADLRPATFSRREKGRVLTQTSGRRRRET
jgi:hypothetical protein